MLELSLPTSLVKEMLSSCRYHIKVCQTASDLQARSQLSEDWLNQLRHNHSNYDVVIKQLKRMGKHSDRIHHAVRYAVNYLIGLVWNKRILTLLETDFADAEVNIEQARAEQEKQRTILLRDIDELINKFA